MLWEREGWDKEQWVDGSLQLPGQRGWEPGSEMVSGSEPISVRRLRKNQGVGGRTETGWTEILRQ